MKNKFSWCLLLLFLCSAAINAQTDPDWELSASSYDTQVLGPTDNVTFNFLKDESNPENSSFVAVTSPLTVNFSVTNNQYTVTNPTSGWTSTRAVEFGNAYGAADNISQRLGASASSGVTGADAQSALFTYAGYATAGTGIRAPGSAGTIPNNYAVRNFITTNPLAAANIPSNSTVYMADFTITFSREVNNPVLHIAGLGAILSLMHGAPIFELDAASSSPSSGITLSKLSGTSNFSVSGLRISNSNNPVSSGGQAAGSILVTGKNITKLVFKIYYRGDGNADNNNNASGWGDATIADTGDAQNISVSVQESELAITKTVNTQNAKVGDNVTFTVNGTNNGISISSNTVVKDLLPAGYTYVSHTSPSGTTYDKDTGVWTVGSLAPGATQTLTITATVKTASSMSAYSNTATISGDNVDPKPGNNTASATLTNVIDAVNDAFGIREPGSTTPSVLTNDTYNTAAATTSNTTFSIVNNGGLTNLVMNADGTFTLPATATPGAYTITYSLCAPANNCDQATVTLTIPSPPVCYNPVTNTAAGIPVKHGITLLKRAGADNKVTGNSAWPMNRTSAHTVLESNTKGFVSTRVASTEALSNITTPVEGMMVYDGEAKCLKIYVEDNTTTANSGWKCFSTAACP